MPERDIEREAADYFGAEPIVAPPEAPRNIDAEADMYFMDTDAAEQDTDDTERMAVERGENITRSEATRRAAKVSPMFYALPRPLRAMLSLPPSMAGEVDKFKRRAANMIERSGGGLAWLASRPQQHTTWKGLAEMHESWPGGADAFARLAETLPEPGNEHEQDVPSAELHDQLDDLSGMPSEEDLAWIDQEPQFMEKMSADVDAEKLYVVSHFGGDWNEYQKYINALPIGKRIGKRLEFLAEDIFAPDPLFGVGKVGKVLALPGKLAKLGDQVIAARKLGEPLSELRGAVKTVEAVHGPIGDLTKHVTQLEKKLDGMADMVGSESHTRVHKRLLEAKAELAARHADAADPAIKFYEPLRRTPSSVYVQPAAMAPEELAIRYRAANEAAGIGEVDEAVKAVGHSHGANFIGAMDDAHEALLRGNATEKHMETLASFERLPEQIRAHFEALGVSRKNILQSAALQRSQADDIAKHADLTNPQVAGSRAFLGPDDVEEAGLGLAHMRDGGDPSHLKLHAVNALEHSVVGQGKNIAEKADGIFLRDLPTYKETNPDGIKHMPRRDALANLLGRQTMPGLAAGSTHVDAAGLVNTMNKVGRKLAFGTSRFLPLSTASLVPEVAQVHNKATRNYELFVNEGEDILRSALKESGLVKESGRRTLKPASKSANAKLDHVIDMLDTDTDEATEAGQKFKELMDQASPEQAKLYHALRPWFDAQATRLGLDKGKAISGYFPHFFPEAQQKGGVRALQMLGLNRKAHVAFWALKHRTGAEGWSRDLINTLDLYNRGAARKIVMEPAYGRIAELSDQYRAAGKHSEASYTDQFLTDARGHGRSIFDFAADGLHLPQGLRDNVELVTREATALFYKALLGGNMNYAIQNMAGGATNIASQHGPFHLMQGLLQFATPSGRKLAQESGVYKGALNSLEGMPRNASQALEDTYKVMDVGQRTEYVLRGVGTLTALSEQIARSGKSWKAIRAAGEEQAFIREAVRAADRTQHTFGPLGRSPYLHTLLGHTGYQATVQLGTYAPKQAEFLARGVSGDPGFIVKYLAYSGMAAHMAAESFGVAIGPSVGFGFAESALNPRKGRAVQYAPGPELISSTVDLYEAWRSGDPREIERKTEAFHRAAEAGQYGINQLNKYSRNLRESIAGKKEKFFEREDMGEVRRQLRTGDVEIKKVERELESTGERITHALGVRSVADQVEQRARKEAKQEKFKKMRDKKKKAEENLKKSRRRKEAARQREQALVQREQSLDAYITAITKGDSSTAHAIYEREAAAGNFKFSADQPQAVREASFLKNRLQHLRKSPGFLPVE